MQTNNNNSRRARRVAPRPWYILPVLFVILGILGALLYFMHDRQEKQELDILLADEALVRMKVEMSAFHMLFHEYTAGRAGVTMQDVLTRGEAARTYAESLMDGGKHDGIPFGPIDQTLRGAVAEMLGLIDTAVAVAERSMSAGPGISALPDANLDAAYGRVIVISDNIGDALHGTWFGYFKLARSYTSVILVVWICMTALLAVGSAIAAKWRVRAEKELRTLYKAVEQSPECIVITDIDANIEYVNPRFTELTGYTLEEAIGQNPRILKSGRTPQAVYEELWAALTAGKTWRGEFLNKKKNGDFYWEAVSIAPITDKRGVVTNYVAVKEDITERKKEHDEKERLFRQLEDAVKNIRTLSGLIPICAYCKKIRDDKGYWQKVETYVEEHSDAEFTHGICNVCSDKVIKDARREALTQARGDAERNGK